MNFGFNEQVYIQLDLRFWFLVFWHPPQTLVVCDKVEKVEEETMSLHQHGKPRWGSNGHSDSGCKAFGRSGSDVYVNSIPLMVCFLIDG